MNSKVTSDSMILCDSPWKGGPEKITWDDALQWWPGRKSPGAAIGGISEWLWSHCHEQSVVRGVSSDLSGKEGHSTKHQGSCIRRLCLSDAQVGAGSK